MKACVGWWAEHRRRTSGHRWRLRAGGLLRDEGRLQWRLLRHWLRRRRSGARRRRSLLGHRLHVLLLLCDHLLQILQLGRGLRTGITLRVLLRLLKVKHIQL